ncbi:MAG TPA: nuclear transport factor 2 family protein, partial [Thermoanaerobaculia bacterium]
MRKALFSALGVLLVAGVASAQAMGAKSGGAATPDELRTRWMAAANAKDGAGIAALYMENALLMPPNAAAVKGRAAIQAFFQGMIDQGAHDITLGKVDAGTSGSWAYEAGTYGATFGTTKDTGKYL